MRPDRDDFIQLNLDNIAPEMWNQFEKRVYDYNYLYDYQGPEAGTLAQTPYDILSVNSVRKEIVFLKSSKKV